MWTEMAALIQALPPPTRVLLIGWLATMITTPIWVWVAGERTRPYAISAGVLLQATTVLMIVIPSWGIGTTARIAAVITVIAWLAEFIGSHTGIPFGRYHYTHRLQPQIGGTRDHVGGTRDHVGGTRDCVGGVPIIIPLAWLMMLLPAWAVGTAITDRFDLSSTMTNLSTTLLAALAFTAWDLFLDPQMVKWRLWIWEPLPPGRRHYFGVPWSNYLGWFIVSACITWIGAPYALAWEQIQPPLLCIYGLTWALETFGQLVFWQLPGPAIVGGVGMGLFLLGATF